MVLVSVQRLEKESRLSCCSPLCALLTPPVSLCYIAVDGDLDYHSPLASGAKVFVMVFVLYPCIYLAAWRYELALFARSVRHLNLGLADSSTGYR
jgi:hypothetical protein